MSSLPSLESAAPPDSATRVTRVRARDGLLLTVEEAGDPELPAVIFIHGYVQSRAIWRPVLTGPLARHLRLVAYDARGHGESEDPDPERAGLDWLAADLGAVIDAVGGPPPIIAPWSYGGVVLGEHLRAGARPLGGLFCLAASSAIGRAARPFYGPAMLDNARAMLSVEPATYEAGARAFLAASTAAAFPAAHFESTLAEMLRVPAYVRSAMLRSDADYLPELAACAAPLSILHGRRDVVVVPAMSERLLARRATAAAPPAEVTWLDDLGRLLWLEAPAAFEAALLSLAASRRT
jgi:pimeloyl-ACP methyl ester carboxylesterase